MRRSVEVTIDAGGGRDAGKKFQLTELPASQAEEWAAKAFLALSRAGVDLPDGLSQMGMAGIAAIGFKALSTVSWDDAKPLMAQMMECVKIMPDPTRPLIVRGLIEEDIEEVKTRLLLRAEVFKLHTDFFRNAASSTSAEVTFPAAM